MSERRIKDALLERHLAGALAPQQAEEIARLLGESEADRARLAELEADNRAFLLQHPPAPLLARHEERRGRARRHWGQRLLVPAAALAAFVALLPAPRPGQIELALYTADGRRVRAEQVVSTDGAMRFVLRGSKIGYVAVLGIDPAGKVTVHYPSDGQAPAPYDPKQEPTLPGLLQLAPGEGREQIVGLFSPKPFELGPVVEALRTGRPLEEVLPDGALSARVGLDKRNDR
jgi:hypothetical protein